jgi:translation elongation factor EF-1beta
MTIIERLRSQLSSLSSEAVLKAGAVRLNHLVSSAGQLESLRAIWSEAIRRTMILSVCLLSASIPVTLGMEWLNAKNVAAEKEQHRDAANDKFEIVSNVIKLDVEAKGENKG